MKFKIRKNDNVIIIAGKDKGKKGKVVQVLPKSGKIVVEGRNIMKKNVRGRKQGEKGQIISYSAPLHMSNVKIWSQRSGKGVRVGFTQDSQGKKIRISRADQSQV
jgi:large subunit ribosomal protein L24